MKQNSVNLERGDARRPGAGHAPETSQADTEERKRENARAYQAAMEAVFAIPISGGLGYLADLKWEIAPLGLFVGLAFGFAAFVLRLLKMRGLVAASVGPQAPGPGETGRGAETRTGAHRTDPKQDAR